MFALLRVITQNDFFVSMSFESEGEVLQSNHPSPSAVESGTESYLRAAELAH